MNIYFPLSTWYSRDLGELTLVRILTQLCLLLLFPGSHLQASDSLGLKFESVAQLSSRFWKGFQFILVLVSPWMFKGITGKFTGEFLGLLSVRGGAHMEAFLVG